MRTATVDILGEAHLLCLSTRAKLDIDERFGGLEQAFDQLAAQDDKSILSTTFALLAIMMRAGAIYAERTGEPCAKPLTEDDLFDLVGISELPNLVAALRAAIINGVRREVEVTVPNAETTPSGKSK